MKKQDMDLLVVYRKVEKRKANVNALGRVYLMIILGSIFVVATLYFSFSLQNQGVKDQIRDIENFLLNQQTLERLNELDVLASDIRTLDDILSELQNAQEIFKLQPRFTTSTLNLLIAERPGTVRINSIAFNGGSISLSVSGTRIYSISDYVMRLKRLDVFQNVIFTGYDLSDNGFNSTITVVLKGGR